ncbi:MAG: GNAT family N-acetyltransferase [Promethearchaeota archaeon]
MLYILIMKGDFTEADIKIEKALSEDAVILAELSKEAFHTDSEISGSGIFGGPPGYDSPEFQNWVMSILTYYKIIYEGEIVGGIFLNSRNAKHHILERIFVDPRYHNKGIATKAMELIFKKYPSVVWTLGTPEWNLRTKHFYKKLGFKQIGWDDGDGDVDWRGIWYQRPIEKPTPSIQNIVDLKDGMNGVFVEGVIINIDPIRKVKSKKDGKELSVANGTLRDKSGEITLVLWNIKISQVKVGDKIRIEFGNVNSFHNKLQLNIGYGRLIKLLKL